ncbi:MAG: hypothetical protein V2I27_01540 [Erythrobacter sp.]|jgi:hypothetical protein|nr:hypothetical protein [Erythrobacter sp.]
MQDRALGRVFGSFLAIVAGSLLPGAQTMAGEPTYRVREDTAAPLDADQGWAGEEGQTVAVEADRPFRLRFETEGNPSGDPLALQVRRNGAAWETLEAHDFPYPKREYELSLSPEANGWGVLIGSPNGLAVEAAAGGAILRASGGAGGLLAAFGLPWEASPDITIAARFALDDAKDRVSLIWGLVDRANHYSARIGDGSVSILRIVGGRETLVAETAAPLTEGTWQEVEIEVEEGSVTLTIDDSEVLAADVEAVPGLPGIALGPGASTRIASLGFEGIARAPGVSIVAAKGYDHGEATGDLLDGSPLPFAPGAGISLQDKAPGMVPAGSHGEYEWPLVIRRTGDGPTFNEDGDRLEFRMVRASDAGAVSRVAAVRLVVPEGHLGGTFVETPGRIGPFQAANGDLYFIMEPTETDNKFMMMKSIDGGRSWREVDGGNRPATGDLEAVDARLAGDRILILHQVTNSVRYHTFRTSDHPAAPDSWEIRDEVAAKARAVAQMATIAPRSDGSILAIFLADRLHYVIRSPAGEWSEAVALDPLDPVINAGPQAVTGSDDTVHLAYFTDDGRIWYRRIFPSGGLSERVLVAQRAGTGRGVYGAVLPLVQDPASGTVTIAYRLADGSLWERRVTHTGTWTGARRIARGPVVSDAVDSQQAGADIVSTPAGLLAVFIEEATGSILSARERGGRWSRAVEEIQAIDGAWVRGSIITGSDGRKVYGFVYDAGSKGGTGMNRYAEIALSQD